MFLAFESLPAEFLYVPALESGVGSNDLGLDRGQMDRTRLVRFERFGSKVLLIEPNLDFRAETDNANERRAVEQAFAQSVLAGFEILNPGDATISIDLTPFLVSDVPRLAQRIGELEQGDYSPDPGRSAVILDNIRNFPENALIPAIVTLQGEHAGRFVEDVTPTPDSLSLRISHQFIKLPEPGFQARKFHPRSGYFDLHYRDYAAPLDASIDQRLIFRHRLEPGQTLTYYVDNGTPEPVRSALLEGASWWAEAFAAAGFENAFRVDVLPEGADPLDVRYNAIQWVHRATRGWSYGGSVADPRSGQIIKGHVSLGSLRVRQDQLIAEALTAPFTGAAERPDTAREMALARLRQLSAHEVGHTLGIDHNFAASFSGDASVMDYPHPYFYLDDKGQVGLDRAYQRGIGEWDKLAVRYGYGLFPQGQEDAGLKAILDEARAREIAFIGDQDARVPGAAHPGAHLWDNGSDVLGRLQELLVIRRTGLENFSTAVISESTPLFEMERRLVPVYLLHRYQLEAAAKLIGGVQYDYALKGDDTSLEPVKAATQKKALAEVLALLEAQQLALPLNLRYLIPPPVLHLGRDREFFAGTTGAPFDHLAPARAASQLVITELLQPQRLSRMAEQHSLDPQLPGADELVDHLLRVSWHGRSPGDTYLAAIRQEVSWQVLRGLMNLAADGAATDTVRAVATGALARLSTRLGEKSYRDDAQAQTARIEIQRFLNRPLPAGQETPIQAPPGSPIG